MAAAILVPTCLALVATTFPKGPLRNAATAVLSATAGVGSVMGLVVGGALTEVSWRLAFLVNVPIGLLVLYLARTTLRETQKERMKLDTTGAVLATLICTACGFRLLDGAGEGLAVSHHDRFRCGGSGRFRGVRRGGAHRREPHRAVQPVLRPQPAGHSTRPCSWPVGRCFTLTVVVALYVQSIMGYSPLRAGISFIPFAIAMAIGVGASSRLVSWFPPRVVVIAGAILMLGAMLYGSTLNRGVPYFPNLVLPLVVGAIGLGMINVPLTLSLIASVGVDRIGPASAIAVMLQSLGGPLVLAVIQAAITSRTLHLGGTRGPVKFMNAAQLNALDHGYHLRPAVAGRGGHPARRGGAAHRLHRAAGGAGAASQEGRWRRGTVARH